MGSGNWQVAKDHKAAFKDLIPEFGGKVRRDWDLTEQLLVTWTRKPSRKMNNGRKCVSQ